MGRGGGYDPYAALRRQHNQFWDRVERGEVDPLDAVPMGSREPYEAYEGVPVQTEMIWAWRMYTLDTYPVPGPDDPPGRRQPAKLKGVWQAWDTREVSSQCGAERGNTRRIVPATGLSYEQSRLRWHLSNGGSECSCGTYATKSLKWLAYANGTQQPDVIAHCTCWGYVVEAEYGYRAEKVRMEALWIIKESRDPTWIDHWAYDLYNRYQVPIFHGIPEAYVYEPALDGVDPRELRYHQFEHALETVGVAPTTPLYPQMRMEDLFRPSPAKS